MKKNYKIIYSLALGILLTSCDNKLDVKPVDNIDSKTALQKSSDVEALLIGAYDSMTDADVLGGNMQRDAELIADNGDIQWQGTFVAPAQIFGKNLFKDNGQASTTWLDAYRTINVANTILANLNLVDASKKQKIEGEAKLIRAWMNFELVRVYAKTYLDGDPKVNLGIPIITSPTLEVSQSLYVKRNTVDQVYQVIISDLTSAESILPASNSFFATKYTAAALLSRVYLMQGNYEGARQAAHRVISSNVFRLTNTFGQEFNNKNNTTEDIFAAQQTDQDNDNALNTFWASATQFKLESGVFWGGGRGDIIINDQHLNSYDLPDDRGDFFYVAGDIFTAKWAAQIANIPLIRLAEMYLTRAEGNFRVGGTPLGANPVDDINILRKRANANPYASVNLATILRERRFELAFEGHWIHDIKRNKQTFTKDFGNEVKSYPYNSPKLIFPIPMRETDANSNMVQNEGY